MSAAVDNQDRTQKAIYMKWNLWKERCRRVFDNKAMSATQLQQVTKIDVGHWSFSRRALCADKAPG
jgi:hypothetical protein